MPNFYITDTKGQRHLFTPQQLKALAEKGKITPDTLLETDNGHKGFARQIKGLFPEPSTVPEAKQTVLSNVPAPVAVSNTSNVSITDTPVITAQQDYDYRHIASLHRLSTWSILTFILARIPANMMMASDITDLGLTYWFGFGIILAIVSFSVFCMVRLAKSLQFRIAIIILLAICLPLPGLCLVPLCCVYFYAGHLLKKAGYKVGFIGANRQQFGTEVSVPFTEKWLVATSIVISISVMLLVSVIQDTLQTDKTDLRNEMPAVIWNPEVTVPLTQTYRDNEHGFSFRYPADWHEAPRTNVRTHDVAVIGQHDNGFSPNMNVILLPLDENLFRAPKAAFLAELEGSLRDINVRDFEIRVINGKETVYFHHQGTVGEDLRLETIQLFFQHRNKTFVVTIIDGQTNFNRNRPIFDSIIGSFRFD